VQDLVTPEVVPDHLDIRDAIQDPDLVHTRQDLEELDGMPLPEDHRDHPGDAVTGNCLIFKKHLVTGCNNFF
jgi:hypothetical protein